MTVRLRSPVTTLIKILKLPEDEANIIVKGIEKINYDYNADLFRVSGFDDFDNKIKFIWFDRPVKTGIMVVGRG